MNTKRWFASVTLALLLAACCLVSASAAGPTSATGAGTLTILGELRNFAFSAITAPDGTVQGQAQLNNRQQSAIDHLDIDCMRVVGNTAVISGVVTSSNSGQAGNTGVFAVQDLGEGKNAQPDRLSLVYFYAPQYAGTLCTFFSFADFPTSPIQGGNIQVR
jgi:hypothetical protein